MRMNYLALAEGLNSRRLIPINENVLNIVKSNPHRDLYTSLYVYQDRHLEEFKKTKSLSGITDIKTYRLFFDFDDALSPGNAQKETIQVFNRLLDQGIPDTNIQIYFSGQKGFHIEVPIVEGLTRQEFVNIVFNLAGDLQTFDVKINDEARILRVPFSRHPKSGLYKIPITFQELNEVPIEGIKEYAKDTTAYDIDAFTLPVPVKLTESINILKSKTYKKVGQIELRDIKGFDIKDIDFSKCPKWLDKARFALSEGYFYGSESVGSGERNTTFMLLAATFRNQGFSAEHTLALLEVTAEKQSLRTGEDPYTSEQLQREVINVVFSPNWKGGIYSSDEPILQITRERFDLDNLVEIDDSVVDISDVGIGFKDFAKNISKNRILTGLQSFDDKIVMTTGMLCTVVSAPGGGKTAWGNMFAETVSKQGDGVLYFSLDLYKNLLFSRMLQRHINLDFEQILNQFESDDPGDDLIEAYSSVLESYGNVGFSFKSTNIDGIEKELISYSTRKGKTPKLVIVDYLDKVKSDYSDPTQSSAVVAGRLSDIAKKYDTCVLLMAQPSKHGSQGPNQEFTSYRSLKGSSSIESDSRLILGIHRPGYNPNDPSQDLYSTVTVLKNNTGPLLRLDYSWNGLAGTFSELNREQRSDLYRLRKEIEEEKASRGHDDI